MILEEVDELEGEDLSLPSMSPVAPPALPPIFTPSSAPSAITQEETELLNTPLPPVHSPLPPELMGERASLETAERSVSPSPTAPQELVATSDASPLMSSARSSAHEAPQQTPALQVMGMGSKPAPRSRGPLISALALVALVGGGYWLGELNTPSEKPSVKPVSLPLPTPHADLDVPPSQVNALDPQNLEQVTQIVDPSSAGHDAHGGGEAPTHNVLTQSTPNENTPKENTPMGGDEPLPLPESPSAQNAGEEMVLGAIDLSAGFDGGAQADDEPSEQEATSTSDNKGSVKSTSTKKVESAAQRNTRLLAQKRALAERKRRQEAGRVAAAKRKRALRKKEIPLNLSRQAINTELKRVTPRLKACASGDPELKGSTVVVSTQIAVSGKVVSAKANTRRLVNSPQRACVLNVIKEMRFPPFQRDMPPIPLPLKL